MLAPILKNSITCITFIDRLIIKLDRLIFLCGVYRKKPAFKLAFEQYLDLQIYYSESYEPNSLIASITRAVIDSWPLRNQTRGS